MKNGKNGQKRDDFFSHFLGKNLPICYYFSQICALFCYYSSVFISGNSVLVETDCSIFKSKVAKLLAFESIVAKSCLSIAQDIKSMIRKANNIDSI